jgi:U3 small nucleolar RNA-associated protein 25
LPWSFSDDLIFNKIPPTLPPRYRIRGVKHVIFYSLPLFSDFYAEILNWLEKPDQVTVEVLWSEFDALKLEGTVGTQRSRKMIEGGKDTYVFT